MNIFDASDTQYGALFDCECSDDEMPRFPTTVATTNGTAMHARVQQPTRPEVDTNRPLPPASNGNDGYE